MMRVAVVGRGRAAAALVPRWGASVVDQRGRGEVGALAAADVVVLAVPDGAIEEVARELATRASARDEIWLHLSGARPSSILRVSEGLPRAVGGLHPLVALADAATVIDGAVAGIEGDDDAVVAAETLARLAGLVPARVDASRKAAYHAAAVTVAGHATALFAQAMTLMQSAGLSRETARAALQPLFASAAANLARGEPRDVITGPIVRGDVEVVRAHLAAIGHPHVRVTYRVLAQTALTLSAARLDPEVVAALASALTEPSG